MESVLKGKKIVISTIVVMLLTDILMIGFVTSLYRQHGEVQYATYKLVQGLIRLVLEMALFFFLYKGYKWAKNVISVLIFIGILLSIISLFELFNIISLFILIVYCYIFIALSAPDSVKDFLAYQRGDLKFSSEENENDLSD